MSTLICLGLGYSAQHFVTGFGARFTRVVGTARTAERAAGLAAHNFGGRRIEMLGFDGETA